MKDDFEALFIAAQANEIDWHGPLFGFYELPAGTTRLTLTFEASNADCPQGLCIKVRGESMRIQDVASPVFNIWTDTAPKRTEIKVVWKKTRTTPKSLRVWNIWRRVTEKWEITEAWSGNSGMRVEDHDDGSWTFRCSDGVGDPDFNNLVATIHAE